MSQKFKIVDKRWIYGSQGNAYTPGKEVVYAVGAMLVKASDEEEEECICED